MLTCSALPPTLLYACLCLTRGPPPTFVGGGCLLGVSQLAPAAPGHGAASGEGSGCHTETAVQLEARDAACRMPHQKPPAHAGEAEAEGGHLSPPRYTPGCKHHEHVVHGQVYLVGSLLSLHMYFCCEYSPVFAFFYCKHVTAVSHLILPTVTHSQGLSTRAPLCTWTQASPLRAEGGSRLTLPRVDPQACPPRVRAERACHCPALLSGWVGELSPPSRPPRPGSAGVWKHHLLRCEVV